MTNARPDWWNGFFDGLMAEFWQAVIPPEATAAEAAFLEKALRLAPGARVLDVPCGHGRHALELARRGYRVSGVDLSADLLGAARISSAREGAAVEWVSGDMRDLPWTGVFDGAYCAGNAFGYFDDAGNQAFLTAVARTLRPGGRFVVLERLVRAGATGLASHGWTIEQAEEFASACREFGFQEVEVEGPRQAGRRTMLAITAIPLRVNCP